MHVPAARGLARGLAGLLLALQVTSAARNYDIVLEKVDEFEVNPEYIAPGSVFELRKVDRTSLPALFHIVRNFKAYPNDTELEATIYDVHGKDRIPSWLRYKMNFCDYLANEKRAIFSELGRLYHFGQCPILGTYKLENYRPDDRLLPPYMPGLDHMIFAVKFSSGTTLLAKYAIMFSVDRKRKRGG